MEGTDLNGQTLENFKLGSFIATASMSGHIVNIPQLQAAYNGAKAAVIQFGESFQSRKRGERVAYRCELVQSNR